MSGLGLRNHQDEPPVARDFHYAVGADGNRPFVYESSPSESVQVVSIGGGRVGVEEVAVWRKDDVGETEFVEDVLNDDL